jgi:alpha-ketoglutarate-dependent taurine dioxygenase
MRLLVPASIALTLIGCGRPAPDPVNQPVTETAPAEAAKPTHGAEARVAGLFARYQKLPEEERNTLKGDKLIAQIELQLPAVSPALRKQVEPTVEAHNKQLLFRALNDPAIEKDLAPEPVYAETETAPPPREAR